MLGLRRFQKTLINIRGFSVEVVAAESSQLEKPKHKTLRGAKQLRPVIVQQRERNKDLDQIAKIKELDWRIVGATIFHRFPSISKELAPIQVDMMNIQDKIDDKKREWLSEQLKGTDAHLFCESNPTYEEILQTMPFKPASRVTEADEKNDRHSVDRRLQDHLFLIVKRNRKNHPWQFPQGKWLADETLLQTGERVIERAVGLNERWFVSNGPQGHYCYEYPAEMQDQRKAFGAKVFYTRAQFISGTIKLQTKLYTDYAWIARDEVKEYFDQSTAEYVQHLLID